MARRARAGSALAGVVACLTTGLTAGLVAGLLAIAVLPTTAAAQFASGLTPPARPATKAAVAAAESTVVAARDSVAREQRLDMKAWVDSAASSLQSGGVPAAPIPVGPGDSTLKALPARPVAPPPGTPQGATPRTPPPSPSTPPAPAAPPAPVPANPAVPAPGPRPGPPSPGFQPGVRAPDTATALPLLALLGTGMTVSGVGLLRRKR